MANPTDDYPAPFNRKNFSTNERLNWLEEYIIQCVSPYTGIIPLDQFIQDNLSKEIKKAIDEQPPSTRGPIKS